MKTVEPVMHENGFGDLALLATIMITVDESRQFRQESTLRAVHGDDVDELKFAVRGDVHLDAGGNVAQLDMRADVIGEYSNEEHMGETAFEVNTALAAKLGGYAILAAGPSSTANGNAIALVLRVTAE